MNDMLAVWVMSFTRIPQRLLDCETSSDAWRFLKPLRFAADI